MSKKKNYHEFVIKGLNQERFFNKIASITDIYEINRFERNKTSFKVNLKHGRKIRKLILSNGFEILGEKKAGIFAKLIGLRKAYGIIAGVLICISLYCIQMPVVWRICVEGVSVEVEKQITAYIKENYNLRKNSLICKDIEVDLRKNFDNLSFTSVAVVGQSLIINAKEGEIPTEKTENFEAIISPCDCIVKKINLIQGTVAVKVGDVVREGDVLIYPYVIDSFGEKQKVEPKAELSVQTWLVGEEYHKETENVWKRSGRSYIENKLFLFGKEIYVHNGEKRYAQYEYEVVKKPFSKNNILPLIFQKTCYYEMVNVLEKKSYESVRKAKIDSAKAKALQKKGEYDIITEENYSEKVVGDVFTITYRLIVEKELSFS